MARLSERQADNEALLKRLHFVTEQLHDSKRELDITTRQLHSLEEEAVMLQDLAR